MGIWFIYGEIKTQDKVTPDIGIGIWTFKNWDLDDQRKWQRTNNNL